MLNNIEADKVDIDVSSDLKVNSSKLSYGMIKVDDGDLNLFDSEVNSIGFELNDGDFSNSNTVMEKSSVKANDGDISASNATIKGRCQFISQDGDINVTNTMRTGTFQRQALETIFYTQRRVRQRRLKKIRMQRTY